jgi:hypothetical protein
MSGGYEGGATASVIALSRSLPNTFQRLLAELFTVNYDEMKTDGLGG